MLDRLRETVADVEKARTAAVTMRASAVEVAASTGEPAPPPVPDPVGDVAALLADPYLRALFQVTVDGRLDALVRSAMPARPGR